MSDIKHCPPLKRIKLSPPTSPKHEPGVPAQLSPDFASALFRTILRRRFQDVYKFLLSGSEHLRLFDNELKKYTMITTAGSEVIVAWDDDTKFTFNMAPGFPKLFHFLRCAASNVQGIVVENVVHGFHNMITEAIVANPDNAKARSIIYYSKELYPLESLLKTKQAMDYLLVWADVLASIRRPPIGIVTDTLHLNCTYFADFSHLLQSMHYRMRKLKVSFINHAHMLDWNDVQTFLFMYGPTQTFPAHPGITSVSFSARVDIIHPAMHALLESVVFMFPNIRRFTLNLRIYSENKVLVADYDPNSVLYQLRSIIHTMTEIVQLPYELVIRVVRVDQVVLKFEKGQPNITEEFKRIRNDLKNSLPFAPSDDDICFRQKYMVGHYKKLDYSLTIVS
uniref:Uncharacterized protein n=1 Tax=Panagrellus redivivus TaxID=6233 RepID=A0A7E4VNK5_PANRE